MMSGNLYIISGASGSGKTTLLNGICGSSMGNELKIVKAPKYSERKRRDDDDDIIHVPEIKVGGYDIAYMINSIKYGIKTEEIVEILNNGMNALIVLSDFRIIRRMKEKFGKRTKTVYISSDIDPETLQTIQEQRHMFSPDQNQKKKLFKQFRRLNAASRLGLWRKVFACVGELNKEWKRNIPDAVSTEIRTAKIRAFHTRYIDNLEIFDHVILNYNNRLEEIVMQMKNIIENKGIDSKQENNTKKRQASRIL